MNTLAGKNELLPNTSTIEVQRIVRVLQECIKKMQVLSVLQSVVNDLPRYQMLLGWDLTELFKRQADIIRNSSESEADKELLCRSTRSLLRALESQRGTRDSILRAMSGVTDSPGQRQLIERTQMLAARFREKLNTTPSQDERKQYRLEQTEKKAVEQRGVIEKLEQELNDRRQNMQKQISIRNDEIRRLQVRLHQIQKFWREQQQRMRKAAQNDRQEAQNISDRRIDSLKVELERTKKRYEERVQENGENEKIMRKKKLTFESEVENWIQKYDHEMMGKQDLEESIEEQYIEEKGELSELEARFKILKSEHDNQVAEHKQVAARQKAAVRMFAGSVEAATKIQAFWRAFKVRKAMKAKKKSLVKSGKKDESGKNVKSGSAKSNLTRKDSKMSLQKKKGRP